MPRVLARAAALATLLLCSCGVSSSMAPQAALLVEAYPEGTVVSIDGVAVGRSGGPPLSIAADRPVVRVELRSEGFVPRRFDIAVQPGRLHVVTVELWPLVPELDGESSD